ncbi:hypothetical protein H0G86_012710 [Trichoderma simmonsii]|uniref:Uncharacterized protein n=1 Tax=Trichoderma simmonsii TaxID=1491479 RepID=A0A8G0PR56_9HYPO|nr:hypothetical protein H0G86_012710 [Trichoderma simmonsii]
MEITTPPLSRELNPPAVGQITRNRSHARDMGLLKAMSSMECRLCRTTLNRCARHGGECQQQQKQQHSKLGTPPNVIQRACLTGPAKDHLLTQPGAQMGDSKVLS